MLTVGAYLIDFRYLVFVILFGLCCFALGLVFWLVLIDFLIVCWLL